MVTMRQLQENPILQDDPFPLHYQPVLDREEVEMMCGDVSMESAPCHD